MISISAKTTEPELALKLLEKIHTDQRYYALVAYGVEGSNYNLVDGKINFDGIGPDTRFAWTAAADDTMTYEAVPVNRQWSEGPYLAVREWWEEIGKTALDNPLDGFNFVLPEKEEEAMDQVWLQYFQPLVCGYGEDYQAELEKVTERMYESGFDRYLETIQEQLAECRAANRDGS